MSAAAKLAALQAERAEVAGKRTKEDVRELAEQWLATASRRANLATGFILNGHANQPEVELVLAEFLLESPALRDFVVRKVEAASDLTNRDRSGKLKKLDAEIEKAEAEAREHAKAAAIAAVEEQYGQIERDYAA